MRGHSWTRGRLTHGWKPAPVHGRPHVPDVREIWGCAACGSEVFAFIGESMRDARKRMKVPFDCMKALAKAVHEE